MFQPKDDKLCGNEYFLSLIQTAERIRIEIGGQRHLDVARFHGNAEFKSIFIFMPLISVSPFIFISAFTPTSASFSSNTT